MCNPNDMFLKTDIDLLKTNLQKYLSLLLDFFIKNTPEKRKQTEEHKDSITVTIPELETETKNFLSILVDRNLTENMKYELFKKDIENGKVDIRFYYLAPESINLWLKIINRSEYKLQRLGRDLLAKNVDELIKIVMKNSELSNGKYVNFVNLGVGAAVKDYYILKAILENMPENTNERMWYVPVDYSVGILERTMDYLDDLMQSYPNRMHIEGILGNFYELVRYM